MAEGIKYVSVSDGFQKIENLVEAEMPPVPLMSVKEFFASEQQASPEHMWVDDEQGKSRLVWQRSVDIAWTICANVGKMYVAQLGGEIEEVLTEKFGDAPDDMGLSNKYFDILKGRTVTGGFVVKSRTTSRSGCVGETAYIDAKEFEDSLSNVTNPIVDHVDMRSLGEAYQAFVISRHDLPAPNRAIQDEWRKKNFLRGKAISNHKETDLKREFAPDSWSGLGARRKSE